MKLALIPPIELLEYTDETTCQLMLPHLLENETYRYVYQKHCEDPDQFVILDNGIAEAVEFDWSKLMDWATLLLPDEIVIPDVMGDYLETLKAARSFRMLNYDPNFKYMFVAQGESLGEFRSAIEWAHEQDWIHTIGLPRHAPKTVGRDDARHFLDWLIVDRYGMDAKPVHLLGGAPHLPTELRDYNWSANVRSTDTSAPFNFAYAGYGLTEHFCMTPGAISRPEGYFDIAAEMFDGRLTDENVRLLMEWTGNDL